MENLTEEKKVINKSFEQQSALRKGIIEKDRLLEAGVQFGHKKYKWNPAMKPFIHGTKDNTHIINLNRTLLSLQIAYNAAEKISAVGGSFLFVGTNKQSASTIRLNAERTGSYFVNQRWLGGTLTNFKTILNSIKKLRHLERLEKNNFEGYTKKEALKMRRTLEKLERSLGGIKFMRKTPNAIFVTSIVDEDIVIKEAQKLNITVIGIADTNSNPRDVKFPIFANDDANKSVALITTLIADAIASSKGEKTYVVNVEPKDFKILGLNLKNDSNISMDSERRFESRGKFRRDFDNKNNWKSRDSNESRNFDKSFEKKPRVEKVDEVKKEEPKEIERKENDNNG